MEIWKDIKDYEGIYQASSYGQIRSLDRTIVESKGKVRKLKGKIIKPMINKGTRKGVKPRYELRLSKNNITKGFQVHRLIAMTFLEGDKSMEVNHIDGNALNNNINNLEFVSRLENIRHAFENKLIATSKTVLKIDIETGVVVGEYYSVTKAAKSVNGHQSSLCIMLNKSKEKRISYKGFLWEYK